MIEFKEVAPTFTDLKKPDTKDFSLLNNELAKFFNKDILTKASILTYNASNHHEVVDIFTNLFQEFLFEQINVNNELKAQIKELNLQIKKIISSQNKVYLESFLTGVVSSSIKLLQHIHENNRTTNQR